LGRYYFDFSETEKCQVIPWKPGPLLNPARGGASNAHRDAMRHLYPINTLAIVPQRAIGYF
jgi:hypothetical protein